MHRCGINPPVPPFDFANRQRVTRDTLAPEIAAVAAIPPSLSMIVEAGFQCMAGNMRLSHTRRQGGLAISARDAAAGLVRNAHMAADDPYLEWLKLALSRPGMSQRGLAEHLGVDESAISKILHGRRRLKADEIPRAAAYLGSSPPTFGAITADEAPDELTRVPDDLVWKPEPDFPPETSAPFTSADHYRANLPGGTPEIEGSAGAGYGTLGEVDVVALSSGGTISGHRVVDEWVLPKAVHRDLRTSPKSLVVMAVDGESMRPTLEPEDRIFVDTARTTLTNDGIYLIDDGDGFPRVKRLQKVLFSNPPEVVVISDNKSHAEQTVRLSRLRILGRVCGRLTRM